MYAAECVVCENNVVGASSMFIIITSSPQNTTFQHTANSNPLTRASQDTSATPAHLTALRFLCNCFQAPALTTWLTTNREMLLDAFAGCTSSSNKNVRQALAALLLNFAVAALVQRGGEGGRGLEGNGGEEGDATEWLPQVLSAVLELMVNAPGEDVETWFRYGVGCPVSVWGVYCCCKLWMGVNTVGGVYNCVYNSDYLHVHMCM